MNQQQKQAVDAHLQFLQQYNLGSFKKKYTTAGWGCLLPVVIFVTTWVILVCVGFAQAWEHMPKDALGVVGMMTVFTFMMSIGIGILVILLISINRGIRRGNLNAYLYEHGFIYCTSKGIVEQVVRWTDITVFRQKVEEHSSRDSEGRSRTTYSDVYTVTLRNTEKPVRLSFGKEFAKATEWAVATLHYPSARSAYWSGSVAHFGRLAIGPQGLYDTNKRAMLPWNEVESIKVSSSGTVYITKVSERRSWSTFPIGAVNNPEVLRRLIATEVPYRFEVLLSR